MCYHYMSKNAKDAFNVIFITQIDHVGSINGQCINDVRRRRLKIQNYFMEYIVCITNARKHLHAHTKQISFPAPQNSHHTGHHKRQAWPLR